jgi:hypothetical protein
MSESMMPSVAVPARRGWLIAATIGVAMAILTLFVLALTMLDKSHFGWLVGTWFLEVISAGMMVGGLILLISASLLPERKTWRGITLILWGLVAFTSPGFGIMFLFPWMVLALTLPLAIVILRGFFRARRT